MNFLFLMNPLEQVKPKKDTSFAFMQGAQRREHQIFCMFSGGISLQGSQILFDVLPVQVAAAGDSQPFRCAAPARLSLDQVDAIFIRTDPPFDERYLLDTLASVSLPAEREFLSLYPRELSVGLAQRVLIAMAILHRPALLLADEPTSALDAITQSEILALFRRLNEELGAAILYISHDLLSVACLCRRVAILREGEIVECGETEAIFQRPAHPYTQRLVQALPQAPAGVGSGWPG